jgi:hypothetical protein
MIDKYTWVCSTCSQGLTRKSSAKRHNNNLHSGNALIVRPFEYIIGRLNGKFPPTTDPLLYRHKNLKDVGSQYGNNNSAYSHDRIPQPQNKIVMGNAYNSYGIPSSDLQPDLPYLVSAQEPFHNEGLNEKQSSASYGPLKSMTKFEELYNLLNKHYSHQDAVGVLKLVYANLYNDRNEDFLDTTLTQLRDIDRKSSPGFY